jgi:hypothetical protein
MTGSGIAIALGLLNLGILVAAAAPAGPAQPVRRDTVLRGTALELVDAEGRPRANIDVMPGGEVVLRLRDQEGTIRVKLGAGRDGSGLLLANDATEPGVHLLAGTKGSSVRVVNKDGRAQVIAP